MNIINLVVWVIKGTNSQKTCSIIKTRALKWQSKHEGEKRKGGQKKKRRQKKKVGKKKSSNVGIEPATS